MSLRRIVLIASILVVLGRGEESSREESLEDSASSLRDLNDDYENLKEDTRRATPGRKKSKKGNKNADPLESKEALKSINFSQEEKKSIETSSPKSSSSLRPHKRRHKSHHKHRKHRHGHHSHHHRTLDLPESSSIDIKNAKSSQESEQKSMSHGGKTNNEQTVQEILEGKLTDISTTLSPTTTIPVTPKTEVPLNQSNVEDQASTPPFTNIQKDSTSGKTVFQNNETKEGQSSDKASGFTINDQKMQNETQDEKCRLNNKTNPNRKSIEKRKNLNSDKARNIFNDGSNKKNLDFDDEYSRIGSEEDQRNESSESNEGKADFLSYGNDNLQRRNSLSSGSLSEESESNESRAQKDRHFNIFTSRESSEDRQFRGRNDFPLSRESNEKDSRFQKGRNRFKKDKKFRRVLFKGSNRESLSDNDDTFGSSQFDSGSTEYGSRSGSDMSMDYDSGADMSNPMYDYSSYGNGGDFSGYNARRRIRYSTIIPHKHSFKKANTSARRKKTHQSQRAESKEDSSSDEGEWGIKAAFTSDINNNPNALSEIDTKRLLSDDELNEKTTGRGQKEAVQTKNEPQSYKDDSSETKQRNVQAKLGFEEEDVESQQGTPGQIDMESSEQKKYMSKKSYSLHGESSQEERHKSDTRKGHGPISASKKNSLLPIEEKAPHHVAPVLVDSYPRNGPHQDPERKPSKSPGPSSTPHRRHHHKFHPIHKSHIGTRRTKRTPFSANPQNAPNDPGAWTMQLKAK